MLNHFFQFQNSDSSSRDIRSEKSGIHAKCIYILRYICNINKVGNDRHADVHGENIYWTRPYEYISSQ
jgi:hypothetical protein